MQDFAPVYGFLGKSTIAEDDPHTLRVMIFTEARPYIKTPISDSMRRVADDIREFVRADVISIEYDFDRQHAREGGPGQHFAGRPPSLCGYHLTGASARINSTEWQFYGTEEGIRNEIDIGIQRIVARAEMNGLKKRGNRFADTDYSLHLELLRGGTHFEFTGTVTASDQEALQSFQNMISGMPVQRMSLTYQRED